MLGELATAVEIPKVNWQVLVAGAPRLRAIQRYTRYVHVVFTLPRQLSPLALQNKREVYALLFQAAAETLIEVARDPRHLGAEIGFFGVLHTWNQKLQMNPHS
jgi:hypothetical protein